MRLGVLTGGGDCPGLNAVIRGIVRRAAADGHDVVGFRHGWKGVLEADARPLDLDAVAGILPRGGTILGSSRTNPYKADGPGTDGIRQGLEAHGVDVLVPIGGEDTLGVAARMSADGLPAVGVPKTIDNDLGGTDVTFGFHTAVQIATDALDRLHTTAESHDRVLVCEVMGRHAGWIAATAGIAGGADVVLVPERPFDIAEVCRRIVHRHETTGRTFSIVVASEGALPAEGTMELAGSGETDAFGHARLGGIGVQLEAEIRSRTGFDARAVVLGHLQRGGTPTAFDRVLATRFGVHAAEAALAGRSGVMVALQGTAIVEVPIGEAVAELKLLDDELYRTAEVFFG